MDGFLHDEMSIDSPSLTLFTFGDFSMGFVEILPAYMTARETEKA